MLIAITGTPGTGKTSVAELLKGSYTIYSVRELAEKYGCGEMDGEEMLIDVECLNRNLDRKDCIIEGHLSHLLNPDIIIVLRCHPDVLKKRLEARSYSSDKVMENLEAEAIDLILQESIETGKPVYEVDTTNMSLEEVAKAIRMILDGKGEEFRPGNIDFSEVILSWY